MRLSKRLHPFFGKGSDWCPPIEGTVESCFPFSVPLPGSDTNERQYQGNWKMERDIMTKDSMVHRLQRRLEQLGRDLQKSEDDKEKIIVS